MPLAGQDVFKTSLVRPLEYTSNKISTHCFALAILPSLLKPAIHSVAHILQDSNLQSFIISEYTIEFAVCVTSTLRIVDFGLRGEIRTHDLRYLDIAARIELASIVSISIALHYAKRCKTGVLPDCTTRRITRHALEKFFYS